MNMNKILTTAALALMMTACSNDYNEAALQPGAGHEITVTATIDAGGSTLTRAVAESETTITSSLKADEEIAVLFSDGTTNLVRTATVKSVADGTATIEFTIPSSLANNTACTLVYPATAAKADNTDVKTYAELFATQTGVLSDDLDVRRGTATILNDGFTASLSDATKLAAQNAIVKFSLSYGSDAIAATQFLVKDGSDNVLTTVTPTATGGASDLYVAMAPATNAAAFKFEATVGDFTYTYEKSGVTLEASTYYQSPIKMTISKKAGEISFATTSISKTFGDEPFINEPTITGDGTVTYSSSDTKVAEVNATTGEVTIKGDGVAIIKATVTDGPTYTYATNEASYTLGVGTATMTVTAEGYSGTYDGNTHGITVKAPDGATVKYGTTADDYDLEASPSYRDAGTYTVYYKVTMPGFTTVTNSATVIIEKASGTISFDTATPKEALHAAADDNTFTQEVTNTGDGTVTYTISDNTCGATIDASTGKVTFTQAGSVTITATVADGKNYTYATKTATYTLSVSDTTDGSGGVPDNDDYTGGGNPF